MNYLEMRLICGKSINEFMEDYLSKFIDAYGEPNVRFHISLIVHIKKDNVWTAHGMTSNMLVTPSVEKESQELNELL